ncbi:MAG TPA: molybdopterin-dependent oxidoreductase [Roseiflexaceae bacterium]|nr:molybdopterin-dependent oxidoreductase [Roseiflexaceae bacterium]
MLDSQPTALVVRQDQPFNAGPPLDLLHNHFLTPADLFFTRNHGAVPRIDPQRYRLLLDGLVERSLSLSLDELRADFPQAELVATLQCAGLRRDELDALEPIPGELLWNADPISTAVWRGVWLRDLLRAAGLAPEAQHIELSGLDELVRQERPTPFGGSIPLDKALSGDVLLAYEMNGQPLSAERGFPLRAVVPGYIGARSIKWLGLIRAQAQPSDNFFQTHAYKLFPPEVRAETVRWDEGQMLGPLPVNAAICTPADGATLEPGVCLVRGYAISGCGAPVRRVELSADNGQTWLPASVEGSEPWAWQLWELRLPLAPGRHTLLVRATDAEGRSQPADLKDVWNFKGYANNAWHRVTVEVRGR